MPGQLMAPGCGGQAWVPKPVAEVPSAVREAPVLAPPAPQAPWLSLPTELGPWDHVAASSLSFFFFSEGQGNLGGLIGRLPPLLLLPPATRLAALAWLLGQPSMVSGLPASFPTSPPDWGFQKTKTHKHSPRQQHKPKCTANRPLASFL